MCLVLSVIGTLHDTFSGKYLLNIYTVSALALVSNLQEMVRIRKRGMYVTLR